MGAAACSPLLARHRARLFPSALHPAPSLGPLSEPLWPHTFWCPGPLLCPDLQQICQAPGMQAALALLSWPGELEACGPGPALQLCCLDVG